MSDPLSSTASITVRALLLGERIDTRSLESGDQLALSPLAVGVGEHGLMVIFRYGAVVLFDVQPLEEATALKHLEPLLTQPYPEPQLESMEIRFRPEVPERVEGEVIYLEERTVPRLQVVADIMGKTVVLDRYEATIAEAFDLVEPVALGLQQRGRWGRQGRKLLKLLGNALVSEQKMTGRVEVSEKPEILWENPELERLFLRLEDEFEIKERNHALERKLDLISRTSHAVLELEQNSRSLRVEWYIVILILVEIVLTLYEFFWR